MNDTDPYSMVDISRKKDVFRTAVASGKIILQKNTIQIIKKNKITKGDPLAIAEIASIHSVKKTPDLISMCHNILIGSVDTKFICNEETIEVICKVTSYGKTGVEMEALTGVSVALLNIWDMVKYLEKDETGQYPRIKITDIRVLKKEKSKN